MYKKMSSQVIEIKLNELSNNTSIKLMDGLGLYIYLIKNNIDNGKQNPVDSIIKNNQIAFCSELYFGILSFNNYLDIGSMNIISSSVEIN